MASLSELEPGDLIFYTGTYYKEGAKPQIHDVVHVEIFAGGEGTVGSRERYKWVKEYDDYRIETSKYWKLGEYHFCKIDAWLEGKLASCCPEHPWPRSAAQAALDGGNRSVFAAGEEGDRGDDAEVD